MASRGSKRVLRNGLTPKEEALKNEVIKQIVETGDINQTKAALKVYNTKNPKSAGKIASEVLAKPEIREQIEKALEANGLNANTIMHNIGKLASTMPIKVTGETVLKSNIELLKLLGAYPDKKGGGSKLTINQRFVGMSFDQARKFHESMSGSSGDFIQEAEVL